MQDSKSFLASSIDHGPFDGARIKFFIDMDRTVLALAKGKLTLDQSPS